MPIVIFFSCIDYCAEAGMAGFNCPAEQLCVPFNYLCDGVPDCYAIVDENLPECFGQYQNYMSHEHLSFCLDFFDCLKFAADIRP